MTSPVEQQTTRPGCFWRLVKWTVLAIIGIIVLLFIAGVIWGLAGG